MPLFLLNLSYAAMRQVDDQVPVTPRSTFTLYDSSLIQIGRSIIYEKIKHHNRFSVNSARKYILVTYQYKQKHSVFIMLMLGSAGWSRSFKGIMRI